MKIYNKKEECCGCTACKNICPTDSITMKTDTKGFLYPMINKETCIECKMCVSVCPLKEENQELIDDSIETSIYAVKHKSAQSKLKSSSGGIYTALTDIFLESNEGVSIYGVKFNKENNFKVYHSKGTSKEERNEFRGSKYVQSTLNETFKEIKDDLLKEKNVFFTGTPCQVSGLNMYLKMVEKKLNIVNLKKNLLVTDIVCHGVPSPLIWKDYIQHIQKKKFSKLIDYTFRLKDKGWRGYNIKATFTDGESEINTKMIKSFIKIFNFNLGLRSSCYKCKFSNMNRKSDITIGDFWGIEKSLPLFDDNKGVSLVILNTKKGKKIFEDSKKYIEFEKSNVEKCLQHNLISSTKEPSNNKIFWNEYKKKGFYFISKKYSDYSLKNKLKKFLKFFLKL